MVPGLVSAKMARASLDKMVLLYQKGDVVVAARGEGAKTKQNNKTTIPTKQGLRLSFNEHQVLVINSTG